MNLIESNEIGARTKQSFVSGTPILYFPPINKLGNVSFRRVVASAGAHYVFTEMTRVEKILEEDDFQLRKVIIPKDMAKITIVQLICDDISNLETGIKKVLEINPFVFEINYNMGCPQSSMCSKEQGGGIVGNPDKVELIAKELFRVCVKYNLKPSIKIRIGIVREDTRKNPDDSITIYENVKRIKEAGIKKIYIHGRVLRDGYNRPATHVEIKKVREENQDIEIIVNGDIKDSDSLKEIVELTGCTSALVGRAALEDPYIFKELLSEDGYARKKQGRSLLDIKDSLLEFLQYVIDDKLSISQIKHNLMYMTKNTVGGADFRAKLNNSNDVEELRDFCMSL
jgi:tRNA-dihydrouridine synthase